MSNLRQAAQQALEALENLYATLSPESVLATSLNHRIDALRAALAEPDRMTPKELAKRLERGEKWELAEPKQEPCGYDETTGLCTSNPCCYTAPPQRKPLTDEEIDEAWKTSEGWRGFARAIEAAHGIKERT